MGQIGGLLRKVFKRAPRSSFINTSSGRFAQLVSPKKIGFGLGILIAMAVPATLALENDPTANQNTPPQTSDTVQTVNVEATTPAAPEASTAPEPSPVAPSAPRNEASSHTEVTVNGQSIPVPENGTRHETVTTNNGQTSVDISVQNSSSGSTTNVGGSSSNVHVYSHSVQFNSSAGGSSQ